MYEDDTGLYYMRARYYCPEIRRFVNADKVHGDISNALTLNRYAFCNGNPAVNVDPEGLKGIDARGGSKGDGTYWTAPDPNVVYYYGNPYATGGIPKWLSGTLNIVGGTLEMFAGAALGATLGWTGVGSFFAGLLVVDGAGRTTQGIAQTSNDITNSNTFYEGNIPKELVKDAGRTIAGDTGAMLAGVAYDASVIAAGWYAGTYRHNCRPSNKNYATSAEEIATSGSPHQKGVNGENLANIDPRQKVKISINGRIRIPDGLTDTKLTEVKNVKYISNTLQLRDFADYAKLTNRELELFVRPTTKIAKTITGSEWTIKYLW